MVNHTIEANFEVKADAAIAERSAAIDARTIELLAEVIATPGAPEFRHHELARMIYMAISALPSCMARAISERESHGKEDS